MDESERLQRYKHNCWRAKNMDESERLQRHKHNEDEKEDQLFADRISKLLNHPKINEYCMVDAYYYDFSEIPREVQEKLQLWRDVYLIYGITTEGEIVSKWVERYDLDNNDPIIDGKVIHYESPCNDTIIPECKQSFNPKLLSTPAPQIFNNFKRIDE